MTGSHVSNKTAATRGTWTGNTVTQIDTARVRRTKRLAGECNYRNQYISAELPMLAYVPQIVLTPNSKYRMAPHG